MGCCVSSNNSKPSTRKGHADAGEVMVVSKPPKHEAEEETVKQVLSSETPKWNNNNNNNITNTTSIITKPQPQNKECKIKKAPSLQEKEKEKEEEQTSQGQVSEEVCSLMSQSDTISMSTTTTISEQAEAIQQTRKRVIRSPNKLQKNRSFSAADVGANTRRDRKLHASNNNNASARLHVQCRDIPARTQSRRHDPGETSFRRSRSLATCVASDVAAKPVIARCPSARRTNKTTLAAAGTSTSGKDSCRKTEVPARGRKGGYANETLENPLVSLECFIFI
ncbi:hypothetical protein PIB30_031890 [Stylosanthes scabra]|uniref:Uncharacterized protein n=1 Tax=Stylosanthes scabra TaxID=79078 RepID=A0ABU6WD93_9FABA|nr:hypothetical protein [Stylosanthes scabra]